MEDEQKPDAATAAQHGNATERTQHGSATEPAQRILVEREGWAMDCCGEPFRIGDEVTWSLQALPPLGRASGRAPRFLEEHHLATRPTVDVRGVVRSITGRVTLGRRLGIGEGVLQSDRSRRVVRRLDTWDRSIGGLDLEVELEIGSDARLPLWTPIPPAVRESPAPPPTEVVAALHTLLLRLHATHGERVRIRSLRRGAKASLLPVAQGAGALHWATGPDTILVNLEYLRIPLPATIAGVARLSALADQLARGTPPADPAPGGQGGLVMMARRRSVPTSPW